MLSKIFTIATREYLAVVRSKAFVISIILLPVMMVGSAIIGHFSEKVRDEGQRRIAIIDRTPGRQIYPRLVAALEDQPELKARFTLEPITPAAGKQDADEQNYSLSERVRRGKLSAILEIGENVPTAVITETDKNLPDDQLVGFRTNTPTAMAFRDWASRTIHRIIQRERLTQLKLTDDQIRQIQSQLRVVSRGLARKDAKGAIVYSEAERDVASFLIPFGLVFLMFLVVIIGAVPMMQGIVEEKQNRIAEVLLGSVTPFELMAGKVFGIVATSFTLILVYLGGAWFAVQQVGLSEYLPADVMAWFMILQLLAVLMYGSLYIAIGAACTDTKEMQSLLMPVNIVCAIPLMLILPILFSPQGMLARVMTVFPPATPFVTIARLAVPPGLSMGERLLSVLILVVTTLVLIWASGRIFRIGILMQGKGANFGQLMRWVVRG